MTLSNTRPSLLVLTLYAALSATFCSHFFSWSNLRASGLMDGDPALNAWALQWVSHALVRAPAELLQGNAFFPTPNSIALSEHMFSLALINVLIQPFADSPWVGYNLLIFLAYVLSCTGAYRLTAQLTGCRTVAFFGGVFWGFLFFRIHHLGHLQILSFQWMPYTLFYLLRFGEKGGWGNAAKLALFVALQSLTSWYLAVINALVLMIALPFFLGRRHLAARFLIPLGMAALTVTAVVGAFAPAYVQQTQSSSLSQRMLAASQTGDAVRWADFVTPPQNTWLGARIDANPYWIWQENTLYIGVVPLVLAAVALVGLLMNLVHRPTLAAQARWSRRAILAGLALVVLGYLFALGFVSQRWGMRLPLDHLARVVPFLYSLRATQRMALVVDMGVLLMATQGLLMLTARMHSQTARVALTAVLAGAYLFEVFPVQLPLQTKTEFAWDETDKGILALQRKAPEPLVVLNLPIHHFRQVYAVQEATYMVGSTLHWARIINGFSGAVPQGFEERMRMLNGFPSPASWALMKELGIDVIALHPELTAHEQAAMTAWVSAQNAGATVQLHGAARLLLLCFGHAARSLGCP